MELYEIHSVRSAPALHPAAAVSFSHPARSNLMQFLSWSKELGWQVGRESRNLVVKTFLQVIGSALGDSSVPLSSTKLNKPTLLVMGNEGRGLRTNVLRECDVVVQIEGASASVDPNDLDGENLETSSSKS